MPRPAGTYLICLCAGAAAVATPAVALADFHIYSYDPKSAASRALTQTGLSFQFEQRLFGGTRIERIMQTGDRGSADLKPTSDKDLGPGGLKAALGPERPVGALYQISSDEDGQAFVGAVCPGAEKAWLLIGAMRRFDDLTVQAVGKDAGAAAARHCVTMQFSFKSDWRLPERPAPRVRFPVRARP